MAAERLPDLDTLSPILSALGNLQGSAVQCGHPGNAVWASEAMSAILAERAVLSIAKAIRRPMDTRSHGLLESAVGLLNGACESWRALVNRFEQTGDSGEAEKARDQLVQCENRRQEALSLLNEV